MAGPLDKLTLEMSRYVFSGECPHCGVVILSADYVRINLIKLFLEALREEAPLIVSSKLAPPGTKIKYADNTSLQCLTCMKTWRRHQITIARSTPRVLGSLQYPPALGLTAKTLANVAASVPAPTPVKSINVTNYQLIRIKDQEEIESVLSRNTQTYANESSATITRKIGITNSITRNVTIESNKAKTTEGQAGIQILGFGAIQGQIQQQLGQKHATQVQGTLSISEEMTIEIKSFQAIELSITWKVVWLHGNAVLGKLLMPSVEMPYWIPQRLTFDAVPRDAPGSKKRSS